MKIGNVSGTVLKRSILKQLHTVRDESMFEPASEEMCAGIRVKESAPVIFSGTSVYGSAKSIGIFAMARAVNDIAARGADPIGVDVQIQLPPYAYESSIHSDDGFVLYDAAMQKSILSPPAQHCSDFSFPDNILLRF